MNNLMMLRVSDLRIWPPVDRIPSPTLYLSLFKSIEKRGMIMPLTGFMENGEAWISDGVARLHILRELRQLECLVQIIRKEDAVIIRSVANEYVNPR
jgi:hypothetical protein